MFARSTCLLLRCPVGHRVQTMPRYGSPLLVTQTLRSLRPTLRRQFQQKPPANPVYAFFRSIWDNLFDKHLLATNIVSSGVLMVVGDIAAQEIKFQRHEIDSWYDMERVGRMFIVGLLLGPVHHYVYIWMERVWPGSTLRRTLQKIFIDQVVMSPLCIFTFYYGCCFLERKSLSETNQELIKKFPYIYLMDWCMWPPAQFFNFRYLEFKYRVIFVNVWTALYNIMLSYIKHDDFGHV